MIAFQGRSVRFEVTSGSSHPKMIWGDWRSHPTKGGKMTLLPLTALKSLSSVSMVSLIIFG
jgi:hypothetical protein